MSRAVHAEVELDAPPERVWEIVMDPNRLQDWVTTHAGLGDSVPDRLTRGSTFEQRLRLLGTEFAVLWEVAECEPPRSVSWDGAGPGGSTAHVRYEIQPLEGDRSRFVYENDFELPGGKLGRGIGRAVGGRMARREAEGSLGNLRALVEG